MTLGVSDVARSTAFYQALGWERATSSTEEIAWFKTSGSYIGLYGRAALAADAALPAEPRAPFGGITLAGNVDSREAVDAALAAAELAGATILKPAEATEWGGYSGYFADPDGHPWEIAHNPFFPISDDGRIVIP